MKENLKVFWGLLFIAALIVPYIFGLWDDYGYGGVVAAAVALVLILISSRHVKPTFWWQGLRNKKNKKEAPVAKDNSTKSEQQP